MVIVSIGVNDDTVFVSLKYNLNDEDKLIVKVLFQLKEKITKGSKHVYKFFLGNINSGIKSTIKK